MIKIVPAVLPPQSPQARLQKYYCEMLDSKLKFVDVVLYYQEKTISAVEPACF